MAATWTQKAHLQHESTSFYNPNFPLLMDGMRPPEDHGWEAPKAHLVGTENERKALEAISVSVDDAITKQYGRSPMNLFFSRSDSTTLVEIWDFEPDSLRFNYLMDGNGIPRNDIMTIAVRDSFIKSYKSYVDVMVIKHDRRDTVISPPPSRSRRR